MDKFFYFEKKMEEVEGEKNKYMVRNCVYVYTCMYFCFEFFYFLYYRIETWLLFNFFIVFLYWILFVLYKSNMFDFIVEWDYVIF